MESPTGGVKAMELGTRLVRERERLLGMSTEERAWRAQWVKDQHLAPNEPVHVPEYWRERTNPIRRFYRRPLDLLFDKIGPKLGVNAPVYRYFAGKLFIGIVGVYSIAYYFKYNGNDWTKKGGWRVTKSKIAHFTGEEGYPGLEQRSKPSDYASRGFKNSPI